MHYQSDGTQVTVRPPVPAPVGTPGYAQPGSAVAGIVPSNIDPFLQNAIADELCGIVLAGGVALDKNNNAQVLPVLRTMFGFGGSSGTSGWQRLAGGVILQWSFGTTVSGAQDPRYFPLTFPNACFAVVVNEAAAAGWVVPGSSAPQPSVYGVSSVAANGFFLSSVRLLNNGTAAFQPITYNYIAVGR